MKHRIQKIKDSLATFRENIEQFFWFPKPPVLKPDESKHNSDPIPSRFDYVAYDEESQVNQQIFKTLVTDIELELNHIEDGRSKSLAITKLEECYGWIGKAIRDDQIRRNATTKLQEERCNS